MTRRRLWIAASLVSCLGLAVLGFRLLSNPLRTVEQDAVMLLLRLFGARVSIVDGHRFEVLPATRLPFRAELTPYCSSLVSILALTAIAMFILSGPLWKRVVACAAAAAVIIVGNVVRIAGSLGVGVEMGSSTLVLFHDWVGTLFGLAYTMAGFFFMLWLLLPSAKDEALVRAARVSDVL
jgi:exosortase/archaeosortase family protein